MARLALRTAVLVCSLVSGLIAIAWGVQRNSVADDEDVLLFTTSARLDPTGQCWQMPVHGWIFERERDSWWRAALQKGVLEMLELSAADPQSKILERRLEMFLVDNERGKTLTVDISGRRYSIGPSGANGHFSGLAEITLQTLPQAATPVFPYTAAAITAADGRQFNGRIQLLAPHGFSVISDIDDTIKVSQVLDKSELLANTFLREFQPLPDMAVVYRRWAAQGAAFHYVSASPWQLYPELNRFIDQAGFPPGEIQLRYLRIKDRSFFAFMQASREYKTRTIEALIRRYPERKFILVGDSGENDPAIYAAAALAHPSNVVNIYIHLVLSDSDHRRQTADYFKALPGECWHLFETGKQLFQMASTLSPVDPSHRRTP
jgi:phosphatidate phosphatase APP1